MLYFLGIDLEIPAGIPSGTPGEFSEETFGRFLERSQGELPAGGFSERNAREIFGRILEAFLEKAKQLFEVLIPKKKMLIKTQKSL